MAQVLDIDSLLESPLADLHALASELSIEGYRLKRKTDLTIAILVSRGAEADDIRADVEAKADELAKVAAERERELAEQEDAAAAAAEEAASAARERSPRSGGSRQRGGRGRGEHRSGGGGGGGQRGQGQRGTGGQRGERSESGERRPRERNRGERDKTSAASGRDGGNASGRDGGNGRRPREDRNKREQPRDRKKQTDRSPDESVETVAISGVFEPGTGGGGRLRTDLSRRVKADAEVMRGEVRNWRLHRGDVVTGQARKSKRGRTDFQLVSITAVNGQGEQQRDKQRIRFAEATSGGFGSRFAKKLFKAAPVHAGSRVVVTGPTRAAASEMTRNLAAALAADGVKTLLAVVNPRPEETSQVGSGDSFDLIVGDPAKPDELLTALELGVERAKRLAESGTDAAVLIDGIDLLDQAKALEIFNTARNLSEHGSLTVAGSAGAGSTLETQATTIAVVSGGRRLKLDKKASWTFGS